MTINKPKVIALRGVNHDSTAGGIVGVLNDTLGVLNETFGVDMFNDGVFEIIPLMLFIYILQILNYLEYIYDLYLFKTYM
jgi:hypothetical protein